MNKRLFALALLPFLIGCASNDKYLGDKIVLKYQEEGKVTAITVADLNEKVLVNKESCVCLFKDDELIKSRTLKSSLATYAINKHVEFFELDKSEINEDTLATVANVTVGYYAWTAESTYPALYCFLKGTVKICCDGSNAISFLNKYIVVDKTEINGNSSVIS